MHTDILCHILLFDEGSKLFIHTHRGSQSDSLLRTMRVFLLATVDVIYRK